MNGSRIIKMQQGLRNKPFPFYEELSKIWGKDRASGNESATVFDVLEEMEERPRGGQEEVHELHSYNQSLQSLKTSIFNTAINNSIKYLYKEGKDRNYRSKIGKISDVIEVATEHIGRLANCFQHESDSASRRMRVTTEIMKMEELTPSEVLLA